MSRCLCLIPDGPNYQRADWLVGLQAAGLSVVQGLSDPKPGDVLVTWNRHGSKDGIARNFERRGARVLVAENGFFGKRWHDRKWFSLAWDHCSGAGRWPDGGPERWDSWGVQLQPWRDGSEVIILGQRGIGAPGMASPQRWAEQVQARIGGRIRRHPGKDAPAVSLADDLKDARCVLTWHSAAAMQALVLGVPVFHEFPRWLGAKAGRPIEQFGEPLKDDAARLAMFRRAAWAMWTADEIRSGDAFRSLLER